MQSEPNTNNERWITIDGWEDYEVSNFGRVRKVMTHKTLKASTDRRGYMYVLLCDGSQSTYRGIHRLVAEAFVPNFDNKGHVGHADLDKTNNVFNNLEWLTEGEVARRRRRRSRGFEYKKRGGYIKCPCGKEFYVTQRQLELKTRKHCSMACYSKYADRSLSEETKTKIRRKVSESNYCRFLRTYDENIRY